MKDRSEAARLILTALGAGVCGAFGYGAIAHREGPPAMAAALDIAPLAAAVQELQQTLRTATFAADSAAPARAPVVDAASSPAPPASGDLDAAVARFTRAVVSCSERLEKLATEDRGTQLAADMVREMAQLPVTTPPRWDALDGVVAMKDEPMRAVGYLTPAEVLQRFGGPTASKVDAKSATVSWWYQKAESYVVLHFFAGHVTKVEAGHR